jgi:predicted alpha/beta-fold hydrolase
MSKAGAGVPVTSPLFYSAAHTNDTRQALRYITYLYPDAPILGIGFSLGANVLIRYLGEEGEQSRIHAACALACVRVFMSRLLILSADRHSSHGICYKIKTGM